MTHSPGCQQLASIYIYIYMCVCVCVCVCAYTHIYLYLCIYRVSEKDCTFFKNSVVWWAPS